MHYAYVCTYIHVHVYARNEYSRHVFICIMRFSLFAAPKFRITKENHLIIQNVTREDGKRQYVCRAMDMESPVPDAKTMNITLKVKSNNNNHINYKNFLQMLMKM